MVHSYASLKPARKSKAKDTSNAHECLTSSDPMFKIIHDACCVDVTLLHQKHLKL
jgi:hypothetical protein